MQSHIGLPATFTSTGPEALVFTGEPELHERAAAPGPGEPGLRWAGYISAVTNYATDSGPQALSASLALAPRQGADGSPAPSCSSPTC